MYDAHTQYLIINNTWWSVLLDATNLHWVSMYNYTCCTSISFQDDFVILNRFDMISCLAAGANSWRLRQTCWRSRATWNPTWTVPRPTSTQTHTHTLMKARISDSYEMSQVTSWWLATSHAYHRLQKGNFGHLDSVTRSNGGGQPKRYPLQVETL